MLAWSLNAAAATLTFDNYPTAPFDPGPQWVEVGRNPGERAYDTVDWALVRTAGGGEATTLGVDAWPASCDGVLRSLRAGQASPSPLGGRWRRLLGDGAKIDCLDVAGPSGPAAALLRWPDRMVVHRLGETPPDPALHPWIRPLADRLAGWVASEAPAAAVATVAGRAVTLPAGWLVSGRRPGGEAIFGWSGREGYFTAQFWGDLLTCNRVAIGYDGDPVDARADKKSGPGWFWLERYGAALGRCVEVGATAVVVEGEVDRERHGPAIDDAVRAIAAAIRGGAP
jgi:hypothetical protein